jgi:beta-mannosidase
MARVRGVGGTRVSALTEGWQVASAPAGSIAEPAALTGASLDWCPARAPATAASALRAASRWTLDERVDFDAADWWWRCAFPADASARGVAHALRFGGIATVAQAWLNGAPILRSDNMFLEHEVPLEGGLRDHNELVVVCRSLTQAMKARKARPRWRTRLVEAQQLRWMRTALVGRIPAWSPPAAAVGPWRPVVLEARTRLSVLKADVRPRVERHAGGAGDTGVVDFALSVDAVGPFVPEAATARVGATTGSLRVAPGDRPGRFAVEGSVEVPRVSLWWPHTHGASPRYPVEVALAAGGERVVIDLGSAAFRQLALRGAPDDFVLAVNGVDVFCRGACWTTLDPASLGGEPAAYRAAVTTLRRGGMNMIRVCGPFFYEDDALYDACDEQGILIWQDYPFANMDYPDDDPEFVAGVEREALGFLDRTQTAASLVVLCGNSEGEQQAAMIGAPREIWRSPLFGETLARVTAAARPDVAYWPSTPSGGALPFYSDAGTAHYFGVGAYQRPLDDARRARVRFATECLAFANVPDPAVVDELMKAGGSPPQHPRWKARVPRDSATGWDFDDVRDHYLRALFAVDPATVRYSDVSRYLALSRVVTAEVMAATFAEWRRASSGCHGALVWFLRDLWPGAGWGILDSDGRPKAAYHYLRRTLDPVAVLLVDEGLNGLDAHLFNDGPTELAGELRIALFRGEATVASAARAVRLSPRGGATVRVADLFEHFFDATYAYRFGPLAHDVAVATLVDASGAVRSEAFHFPGPHPSNLESDLGLEVVATPVAHGESVGASAGEGAGSWKLAIRTRRFAQSVEVTVRGFEPADNYFHMPPGGSREVLLRPAATAMGAAPRPQGSVRPLNAVTATKVEIRG